MDTKQEADMGVTKESFGFLEDKREAFLYTIENQNGFAVKVTDFGVNIVSLLVKNKEGNIKDVALGYDTLEEYFENGIMFGATVGRNVNRISNARFSCWDRIFIDRCKFICINPYFCIFDRSAFMSTQVKVIMICQID